MSASECKDIVENLLRWCTIHEDRQRAEDLKKSQNICLG